MTKEFFDRGKQIAKWADNNMTKNEALKMAIDQLNVCLGLMATKDYSDDFYTNMQNIIENCTKALKQPKKLRHLYVYKIDGYSIRISQNKDKNDVYLKNYLGKIKLEVDDG
jgi:hypothetical protein